MDEVQIIQAAVRSTPESNHLLRPATSFIGHEQDIAEVRELLECAQLVTLTGAGGIGKTRLGLEIAAASHADFEDGIVLVELASLSDPDLVEQEVCRALGAIAGVTQRNIATLYKIFKDKHALLLLDNCEHMVEACAELADSLLQACLRLHILATSRETLGLPGETVWQVRFLSLPDQAKTATPATLMASEAARLFIERAVAARPDFKLNNNSAEAVARICRRLDGVPLAIELAASWVRILSPMQISERLQQSFDLLSTMKQKALPQQRTIRDAIDWSYQLLTRREKALFSRLAVFDGAITFNAVEAICTDLEVNPSTPVDSSPFAFAPLRKSEILELLYHLVDKSLIYVIQGDEAYFSMLETVREYSKEIMQTSGEEPRLKERFVDFYLSFAGQSDQEIFGSQQRTWLRRYEIEQDNLRGALYWLYEQRDGIRGLRLATALYRFWYLQGHYEEGCRWLERMISLCPAAGSERLNAYAIASHLAEQMGNISQGIVYANQALEIAGQIQDTQGMAEVLMRLGTLTNAQGDRPKGTKYLERSLALYQDLEDEMSQARVLLHLGDARMRMNELGEAQGRYEEALLIFRGQSENSLVSFALGGLGDIARLRGNFLQASVYFREALENYRHLGIKTDVVFNLEAHAILLEEIGQHDRAARLWGAAEALREAAHHSLSPSYRRDYAVYIEQLRAGMGEKWFSAAWEQGRQMQLEEAIELALSTGDLARVAAAPKSPKAAPRAFDLSPREMDVLILVADGMTDAQIASQLYLSPRTVSKHLQSIYRKIEVTSRSAATHFVFEHHLV